MSRIALRTDALRRAQPAPPSRSSDGLDALDAGVLLHEVEALDRQQQRLLLGVLDLHELALRTLDRHALQALESADAVVGVDHGVAELQVPQVREERLGGLAPRGGRPALLAEDLLLGVDREARPGRPKAESRRDLGGDRDDRARPALGGDVEAVLEREAAELLHAAGRPRRDEDLLARLERAGQVRRGLGRAPAVPRDALGREPHARDSPSASDDAQPIEAQREAPRAARGSLSAECSSSSGANASRSGIPIREDALGEGVDLLGHRLPARRSRPAPVPDPAWSSQLAGIGETAGAKTIRSGLGRRPPDPIGHQPPLGLRVLRGRERRQPDAPPAARSSAGCPDRRGAATRCGRRRARRARRGRGPAGTRRRGRRARRGRRSR